ncbi:hypothetical protein FEM48_Zijuj08G0012800 [Ziziphus jujuba var. spinosa]|uniref:HSF-type DNA-binding domain-containing protein n=1 Tax=Ziziphus jujuba var. spinosa TaxID=714518 RepID=A0A978UW56_ZIZJJ|nr:hypothetical protein FEM48_Zijuj08G0012800 [Ziziphus jujuba var. spinosa]
MKTGQRTLMSWRCHMACMQLMDRHTENLSSNDNRIILTSQIVTRRSNSLGVHEWRVEIKSKLEVTSVRDASGFAGGSGGGDGGACCSPLSPIQLPEPIKEMEKARKKENERPKEVVVSVEEEKEEEKMVVKLNCGDGVGSSSSSSPTEEKAAEEAVFQIKEETVELVDDHVDRLGEPDVGSGSGSCSSSSSLVLPKPIEGLHEGFKKVDPDRWEFANEGFRRGKKHLLKNIKRRSRYSKQQGGAIACVDSGKDGLESEVETLNQDHNTLKIEILKLKQLQEDSHSQISAVEERIRCAECKQHQMFLFLIKTAKNPTFIHQLIQKRIQKKELDGVEISKRRRLLSNPYPESLAEGIETTLSVSNKKKFHEEKLPKQSVGTQNFAEPIFTNPTETVFSVLMDNESCSCIQDQKAKEMRGTGNGPDMSSVYNVMSENLLGDYSIFDEESAVNDSVFYHELEDLIAKPRDWGGYFGSLVEQTDCVGSTP